MPPFSTAGCSEKNRFSILFLILSDAIEFL
jgi:hypothetical protein